MQATWLIQFNHSHPVASGEGFNIESRRVTKDSIPFFSKEDSHGAIFTQANLRS
jgi:hypothetical protein